MVDEPAISLLGGAVPTPLQAQSFASRGEFEALIRALVQHAGAKDGPGVREMIWADADFADWPLGERAFVEALTQWAAQHRRLVMLACSFDWVQTNAPRFVVWRRTWSHIVECRELPELQPGELPGALLLGGQAVLRRLDPVRHRGVLSVDAASLTRSTEECRELMARSVPGWPAHLLGL